MRHVIVAVVAAVLPIVVLGQTSTSLDAKLQAPELSAPQRGSLAGQLSGTVFGPGDVARGVFSLPSPIGVPSERGVLLAEIFPIYSPEAGMSEWGLGWGRSLVVTRSNVVGGLTYATDDLTGPWGRMVMGSDGYWYPVGLSRLVRLAWSGDTMVAYLPDGTQLTFGGAARITNAQGTYGWALTDVVTVTNRRTTLAWTANASGRLFLSSVSYGGVGTDHQYRVDFSYEALAAGAAFTDYRSAYPLVLDRRVSTVTVLAKNAGTGVFEERWHYELGYLEEGLGPASYLASVQQVYRSGERPPATKYTYNLSKDRLAATTMVSAPMVAPVLQALGADAMQPSRSTQLDLDQDGRADLEHSKDYTLVRQTDGAFLLEPLGPRPADVVARCRQPSSTYNPPRTLAQMLGDDNQQVVSLARDAYGVSTSLIVCNRLGQSLGTQTLSGDWQLAANVRLVDLNRDHKPDLVRVGAGSYRVLPNTSNGTVYSFGASRSGTLTPSIAPDTTWVQDVNGDGIPDLIARTGSSVVVWYGKGNYDFDGQGRTFALQTATGAAVTNLTSFSFTFVDANRDGLADLLLTSVSGNVASLYVNRGTYFKQVVSPGLAGVDLMTSKPVVADFTGSGNVELSYTRYGEGFAVALDGPETALLASADDGRGTVLRFEYARARPSPGARSRQAVLSRLTVQSSGYDDVTYAYDYVGPHLHTVGKFLLGFDQVTRTDPLLSHQVSFLNEDRYSGVFLSSSRHDVKAPGADAFESKTYEEALFQAVPWKRLKQEMAGFKDGTGATVSEQTDYLTYVSDVCPQTVRRTTSAGALTVTKSYVQPASFGVALSCLWTNSVEQGAHADATLDFRHETNVTRNAVGLVEKVESVNGADRWVIQTATYRPSDWLVDTLSSPGKGTASFAYDASTRLLSRATGPDGVVVEALARDPLHDGIQTLRTTRGTLSYQRFFTFDGQERLASQRDDLGAATVLNPSGRYRYQFATATEPAAVFSSTLVDAAAASARDAVDLLTASGEPVVTASRIPEGWTFGPLLTRSRATGQTSRYLRPTVAAAVDPMALDLATLLTGASQVGSEVASVLQGQAVDARTTFHAGVEQQVSRAFALSGGLLQVTTAENGQNPTQTWLDAGKRVLAFDDEASAHYGYRYDALGRLREVTLPDGNRHRARYDAHGRVWRVERDAVATVETSFDPTTGLATAKRFLTPAGALVRTVGFGYDTIGRVTTEVHTDAATSATKTFTSYYDGATPAAPFTRTTLGFLTAVTGDGYTKLFEYRADGLLAARTVQFPGWQTVLTQLGYLESGVLGSRSTQVFGAGGGLVANSSQVFSYDSNGRLGSVSQNGSTLVTYAYDGNGQLSTATFANGNTLTLSYDSLTRRMTGSAQSIAAYTAATSQRMSPRALVDSETFTVGTTSLSRAYGYSSQRFLTSATDAQAAYGYGFDAFGRPTSITRNGVVRTITPGVCNFTAGGVAYACDALGRTTQRGDLTLTYGPDGQVATATRGGSTWSFKYDEAGQRLLKLSGTTIVAAYVEEGYLDATGLTERFQVAGRTVGLLKNGVFSSLATDLRGTVMADANGTARIASPFGRRDVHPTSAAAIDYVEKGFDADLGVVRMGVRDYDPEVNRFLTPDPLVLARPELTLERPVAANLYTYAGGDPLSFVDPSGLWESPAEVAARLDRRIDAFASRHADNTALVAVAWATEFFGTELLRFGTGTAQAVYDRDLTGGQRALLVVADVGRGAAIWGAGKAVGGIATNGVRMLAGTAGAEEASFLTRVGRFFWDMRPFRQVSREYWSGLNAGDRSLHHWLIPQKLELPRFLEGFRNAGFNLLELPGLRGVFHPRLTLNSWLGFAQNWGAEAAARASLVENGLRLALPATAAGAGGAGYMAGRLSLDILQEEREKK